MTRPVALCCLLLGLTLLIPVGQAAPEGPPNALRLRNRTPFLVTVFIGGVRSGWIKPFRTELFRGLKSGQHTVYVASHYGSASWGPRKIAVPGTWNLTPPQNARTTEHLEEAMASRVYRRNRSSLVACDRLADRRGEPSAQSEFEIEVDAKGVPSITIKGELSKRRRFCYQSVAKTWDYPATGSGYLVNFQHSP